MAPLALSVPPESADADAGLEQRDPGFAVRRFLQATSLFLSALPVGVRENQAEAKELPGNQDPTCLILVRGPRRVQRDAWKLLRISEPRKSLKRRPDHKS